MSRGDAAVIVEGGGEEEEEAGDADRLYCL
jgi:hypothetical protein